MKTTTGEKQVIVDTSIGAANGSARDVARRPPRTLTAAGDRQMAEIERTFTVRYEW